MRKREEEVAPTASTKAAAVSTYSPSLHITEHHGLHRGLRPTHLHLVDASGRAVEWQSRRARKRRYAARHHHLRNGDDTSASVFLRIPSGQLKPHLLMDVSFWIAVAFTVGSVIWVINAFLVWLPYVYPSVGTPASSKAGSALGFVGGIIFNIGSYLMVVEALDRGRETNFGTALGALLHFLTHPASKQDKLESDPSSTQTGPSESAGGFIWWGKPQWHELGYVAAFIQLCAATVFWVSTLTGLPGVIPGMSEGKQVAITDVFFWTPQVVGGVGFTLSSLILMVEVQHHWWLPRPLDLGWQVGFWNLVGSVGFLLCGAFGYSDNHSMQYDSGLATFWGSWAFLIGSVLQCWEVIWREPQDEPNTP